MEKFIFFLFLFSCAKDNILFLPSFNSRTYVLPTQSRRYCGRRADSLVIGYKSTQASTKTRKNSIISTDLKETRAFICPVSLFSSFWAVFQKQCTDFFSLIFQNYPGMSSPSPPLHSWLVFVYLIEAGAGAVVQARMYMKGIKFIRKGDYWFAVCISYKFSLENYGKFVLE